VCLLEYQDLVQDIVLHFANSNTMTLTQQSTGGAKGIMATVTGSANNLDIVQKDSGSHYAQVLLTGGNKDVNILQQGSAGHMANINLSGAPTNLDLTQSGSTQQHYSITHTCATAGGCGPITVTQGN
jgi:glycerate-2-kinase